MKNVPGFFRLTTFVLAISACYFQAANAALFGPSNFGECILENMENVQNDETARAALVDCIGRFPGGFESIEPRNSIFDRINSWRECMLRYGRNTSSDFAIRRIRAVCVSFYPPESDG